MPANIWTLALAGTVATVFALPSWAESCSKSATRTAQLDVAGATRIVIAAGAGELQVNGTRGRDQVDAKGKACASSQELLEQIRLESRREGTTLYVKAVMPDSKDQSGNDYARLDLIVALPDNLETSIADSSGDTTVQNVGTLLIDDSSGSLEIKGVTGNATVNDSSGGIEVEQVTGNLTVSDSSGDIEITQVGGKVSIPMDSSGGIRIERAAGVHVLTDSSGDIEIKEVKGDVLIDNDSSGDISVADVTGKFTVQVDGSGSIRHQRVAGAVDLPRK